MELQETGYGRILWEKISSELPEVKGDKNFLKMFINWIFGVLLVYSILFGTGKLIFKEYVEFLIYLFISILSFVIIFKNLSTDKY